MLDDLKSFLEGSRIARARARETDLLHREFEELSIFGLPDGGWARSEQLDPEPRERSIIVERERQVERRLPAERRQDCLRPLPLEDRPKRRRLERLHVGPIRELRIGHDRGRVRVDQDHLVPLGSEGLRPLHSGVVELAGLPDDDGSRADEKNLSEVVAPRHRGRLLAPARRPVSSRLRARFARPTIERLKAVCYCAPCSQATKTSASLISGLSIPMSPI